MPHETLTETQQTNRNAFLHDLSQALAITPATISQALRDNPALLAVACQYRPPAPATPDAPGIESE